VAKHVRLTDQLIRRLDPAPKGQRVEVYDDLVPSLGVRVTEAGAKSFFVHAKWPACGAYSRRRVGDATKLPLARARDIAREWLALVEEKIDPRTKAAQEEKAAREKATNNFKTVAEEYIAKVVEKNKRASKIKRLIRRELIERFGDKPIEEVSRRDILAAIDDAIARGHPFQARTIFATARALFNWVINRDIYGIKHSPCDRFPMKDIIATKKLVRTRTLSDTELKAFWSATARLGYPYGDIYRLLLLTGLRRSEVTEARWHEVDLKRNVWTIPPSRMKAQVAHQVPMTPDVLAIINNLPRFARGDYLFSYDGGFSPTNDFYTTKLKLNVLMPKDTEPFKIHDLRRTVRSHLSALPVQEVVREAILAHSRQGIQRHYDTYEYLPEKLAALQMWNDRLRRIVGDGGDDNVVTLRA
jgi:integrase